MLAALKYWHWSNCSFIKFASISCCSICWKALFATKVAGGMAAFSWGRPRDRLKDVVICEAFGSAMRSLACKQGKSIVAWSTVLRWSWIAINLLMECHRASMLHRNPSASFFWRLWSWFRSATMTFLFRREQLNVHSKQKKSRQHLLFTNVYIHWKRRCDQGTWDFTIFIRVFQQNNHRQPARGGAHAMWPAMSSREVGVGSPMARMALVESTKLSGLHGEVLEKPWQNTVALTWGIRECF